MNSKRNKTSVSFKPGSAWTTVAVRQGNAKLVNAA